MKFSELRNTMQVFAGAETPEYQLSYITNEVRIMLDNMNNKFVEYLTQDIINSEIPINLQQWLGTAYYPPSNENAKECLEFCPTVKHIWGKKIKTWTDSALKCYDNFLLNYIQVVNEEKVLKSHTGLKETDVYMHLIKKGGSEEEIGQTFKSIYQIRSMFQHIQIEVKDGIRIPKRISNSQCNRLRDIIIQGFKISIISLFELITNKNDNLNK